MLAGVTDPEEQDSEQLQYSGGQRSMHGTQVTLAHLPHCPRSTLMERNSDGDLGML